MDDNDFNEIVRLRDKVNKQAGIMFDLQQNIDHVRKKNVSLKDLLASAEAECDELIAKTMNMEADREEDMAYISYLRELMLRMSNNAGDWTHYAFAVETARQLDIIKKENNHV